MPLYRCQVSLFNVNDVVRDHVVNTIYLRKQGIIGVGENTLATDIVNLWDTAVPSLGGFDRIRCRIYDMADAKPRPVVAQAEKTAGSAHFGATLPREVAVCLSYHGDRNVARKRGRIFLGPWLATVAASRPGTGPRSQAIALGQGISSLGGVDVDHVVYSPTGNTESKVTRVWCDDEWDTQRSRGLRSTTRSSADVSG